MKNKYLQCALVLSSICIVSAGAIGGLNYLAESYKAAHQTDEAPKSIQALDKDASFQKVSDFTPTKSLGVTINAVYKATKGNEMLGYAYDVDGGKPVGNNLLFTILFTGAISDATVASYKPTAINVTSGGDGTEYTEICQRYGEMVIKGEANLDDAVKVALGATSKSASALQNAIKVVRTDYNNRWNGAGPVEDPVPQYIRQMYADAITADEDTEFTPLSFSFRDAKKATKTGKVIKRYFVTREDGSIAWVYEGTSPEFSVNSYGEEMGALDLYVSFEGDVDEAATSKAVKPVKYAIDTENTHFSKAEWESYLPSIMAGGTVDVEDAVVKNGATLTTDLVRSMVRKMRDSYFTDKLAQQKAGIGTVMEALYAGNKGYVLDDGFVAIVKSNVTCNTNGTGNYTIDRRYTVTLADDSTAKVYGASLDVNAESIGGTVTCTLYVGYSSTDKSAVKPDSYNVVGSTMFTEWEEGYLGEVIKGNDPTINVGASYSADLCRQVIADMKADYISFLG